jgi:selenide,water dikinase
VIVGLGAPDDCGVVRLSPDLALVTTVDVFTPVVDDPFDYGRIAAVNSLSDVYAMGARPVSALAIAGFPDTRLPLEVLAEVLRGLVEGAGACGVPVVGGHTVKNPEPLFGLAVSGIGDPQRLVLKGGGRAGDLLVLTKPLGVGVMTTALKNEKLSAAGARQVTALMLAPNDRACALMIEHGASAATDVTGFGLLGHLHEMAAGAGVGAAIDFAAIPVLPEALALAEAGVFPGGARTNLEAYAGTLCWDSALAKWQQLLLADPQTSGGLLIAFPPVRVPAALEAMAEQGLAAAVIGRLTRADTARGARIHVRASAP